jgi:anti-anti-sigma factor
VTVDLRGLTFIDSTGLRLLIRLDQRARTDGCTLTLVDGEGPAHRLLQLTRLRDRFTIARL